ncbi:hypothetical protein KKC45_00225, partial [Patescibacteria group bacterium]|nr:hypothetical protein [Patescibacteria group bacterium]
LVKGLTSFIQIDVMDGIFVPEKSWPFTDSMWASGVHLEPPFSCDCNFEFDLMVAKPEYNVQDFLDIGAKRIIIHAGSTNKLKEIFELLKGKAEIGLAFGIDVDVDKYIGFIESANFVQFMGIEKIGFQGQSFDDKVIDKIINFRAKYKNITISVDGGVNLENAHRLISAGANRLVSGSAIFESGDIPSTIEKFNNLDN